MKKLFILSFFCITTLSVSAQNDKTPDIHQVSFKLFDMHCKKCENRARKKYESIIGISEIKADLPEQTLTVTYDANKTSAQDLRYSLVQAFFTPVKFSNSENIKYAYFLLNAKDSNEETIGKVLAIKGIKDAMVNTKRGTLAVAYDAKTYSLIKKLQKKLEKVGIDAQIPKPHQCNEKKKS